MSRVEELVREATMCPHCLDGVFHHVAMSDTDFGMGADSDWSGPCECCHGTGQATGRDALSPRLKRIIAELAALASLTDLAEEGER